MSSKKELIDKSVFVRCMTVTCAPWNTCRRWHQPAFGSPWSARVVHVMIPNTWRGRPSD